jgi:hypothetical protein
MDFNYFCPGGMLWLLPFSLILLFTQRDGSHLWPGSGVFSSYGLLRL